METTELSIGWFGTLSIVFGLIVVFLTLMRKATRNRKPKKKPTTTYRIEKWK